MNTPTAWPLPTVQGYNVDTCLDAHVHELCLFTEQVILLVDQLAQLNHQVLDLLLRRQRPLVTWNQPCVSQ